MLTLVQAKTVSKSNRLIRFISITPDFNFKVDHNYRINPSINRDRGKVIYNNLLCLCYRFQYAKPVPMERELTFESKADSQSVT